MKKYFYYFLIFLLSNLEIYSQWERIGFENKYIADLTFFNELIIIPVGKHPYTILYGSSDNGETWDSLSYIDWPLIEEVEGSEEYLFASSFWACAGFCSPHACIFRIPKNFGSSDTLFESDYGVSKLITNKNAVFVDEGEYMIKSTDFGYCWDTISLPGGIDGRLFSIDNSVYLSNNIKELFRSDDGGLIWNLINYNLQSNFYSLIENNNYLFAGTPAGILRSSSKGANWEFYNGGLPDSFQVFIISGIPGIIFCGGEDTNYKFSVYFSTDNAETWININEGLFLGRVGFINTLFIKDMYLFAATFNGIWRYNFSPLVRVVNPDIKTFRYSLAQNYPNPFNPTTTITYSIPISGIASLKIYDILGREVDILVNEFLGAGEHITTFEASNLPSGIYFYELKTGNYRAAKKMMLIK